MDKVRVRFAPSPTGPFSIGTARTALYNWLFARHEGGEFFVRIEDTDKERSKKEYEEDVLAGLTWLGLTWDNKEVRRQSESGKAYEAALTKLLDEGRAYYCFCTPDELEVERQAQMSQGISPKYGGTCRHLSKEEAAKKLTTTPAVIRFAMPRREVEFEDLIRGKVRVDTGLIGDIIIARNIRAPLYNFSVVVDDAEMAITHVIRGEDHLSNTPKQLMIAEALGLPSPVYAHLPLILGPGKKKLSKRNLEGSLNDYRRQGYLPEAVLNFLVLLGWHPAKDREVLTREEMIAEFTLKRVQKGGAVFNEEKLSWLNLQHLKTLPVETVIEHLAPFVPAEWRKRPAFLKKVVEVERGRMKTLQEFTKLADPFFTLPEYPASLLVWKETPKEAVVKNLEDAEGLIAAMPDKKIAAETLEPQLFEMANRAGRGELLWPLRVALSGREASPGPLELIEVLGKEESLRRIRHALELLTGGTLTPNGQL
ncbi:MAG: glutamate--tRNA ligase [Candidatus Jorgensenbacteria bacterium]|nr:glutamate--tRNA ligase [Candidatus Jorgensenbacteria bacterium]